MAIRLARILHELPECAVKSGDKPAAVHVVLLIKRKLPLNVIENIKK
jgi:hypothetical protein